jgi:hypothetical protein
MKKNFKFIKTKISNLKYCKYLPFDIAICNDVKVSIVRFESNDKYDLIVNDKYKVYSTRLNFGFHENGIENIEFYKIKTRPDLSLYISNLEQAERLAENVKYLLDNKILELTKKISYTVIK